MLKSDIQIYSQGEPLLTIGSLSGVAGIGCGAVGYSVGAASAGEIGAGLGMCLGYMTGVAVSGGIGLTMFYHSEVGILSGVVLQ